MKILGTAEIKDYEKLTKWIDSLSIEDADAFIKSVNESINKLYPEYQHTARTDTPASLIKQAAESVYKPDLWSRKFISSYESEEMRMRRDEKEWAEQKKRAMQKLQQYKTFHEDFEQPLNVGAWTDAFAYLYFGNPDRGIVVPTPECFLEFIPTPDYDDIPIAQLSAGLGADTLEAGPAILPANADWNTTKGTLRVSRQAREDELSALKAEIEKVKKAETPELAKIKAEIAELQSKLEVRKNELMLELEDKLGDMEEKVSQMEAQIFLLDSQIYAIRCFAGEVVKFTQIRRGVNAPDTEPIIVYQKLRFLDEDLGRLTAIYQLDWEDVGMFEEFLRHSPAALDTFAPNERCVTLVRLSRTATQLGRTSKQPFSNLLENYEYYHGRTVGIIIRNGENLYLGWTDEDRVHITDDLVFSKFTTEVVPAEPEQTYDDELWEKRRQREKRKKATAEHMTLMDGVVSRAFVFNVLQGVVKNTSWLPLPPGENISKQSAYVRFSVADMCLEDHRFADFDALIREANEDVAAGDMILTMQHLIAEGAERFRPYYNARGRGDLNRTHDCRVEDCKVYPVNLVEYDAPVPMIRYRATHSGWGSDEKKCSEYVTRASEEGNLSENCEVIARWDRVDRHVFLSIEKTDGYYSGEKNPRANFEVTPEEFINLTFMNSVWLEWAINTKHLGSWHLKGKEVIYAHAIRYLNTALDFVRKREEEERRLISALDTSICENLEWPLLLSDWKYMMSRDESKRTVRRMTEFQAKRFVQWVKEGTPGRRNFSRPEESKEQKLG